MDWILRGRTIELKFSSAAVCGNPQDPYLPDWDGVPLALTIDSSVPPSGLSPLPEGHSGTSYTWNFPRLNCQAPPGLTASVPVSPARLSWASVGRLREAYNLQQARSLALYGIPLLLALIALGQQLASGSGVEFVKSALSVVPAVFGG